jgi:Cu+-exporting ATPase
VQKNDSTTLECNHCQQPIVELIAGANQKKYCCYGCKVIDELLNENSTFLSQANLNVKPFLYLDEPKIKAQLLAFADGDFAKIKLHLPAIHCSSCIFLLENLPQVETGILDVNVHFSRKEASLTFKSNEIALSQIAALLNYIGYTPDFQTRLGAQKKPKNKLLLQLGVAGFFFGNIMLLALPEYFDDKLANDGRLQKFFRYLMMGFAIPVMVYSGQDYFKNALKSMRAGVLSIDLPIALGIGVLFIRSAYEVLSGTGSGYFDSLAGLIFFLLIGKWYQHKTYQNFTFDRDLRSFLPLSANLVLKNDAEKPVAIDDLEAGHIICVRQGEVLPADAILLHQKTEVDYSYLTGEAAPIEKNPGETIFAGARLKGAAAHLQVSKTVEHSYLSSLWSQESFSQTQHKKERTFTDKVSQYFTPLIILIALVAGGAWYATNPAKGIQVFTAVLIVACPCALALAEPFANGSLMRWFGRHGFFLKNSAVLSRLTKINHLVFDKTGTITKPNAIQVNWQGDALAFADKLAIASIAKNAQHPLAKPLLQHLSISESSAQQATNFTEASGEGVTAEIDGYFYRLGKASYLGLKDQAATTAVYVEKSGRVLGYFTFYQEVRAGLQPILEDLAQHYQLSLLSGDNSAEEKRFSKIFPAQAQLVFNQNPHDKLDYLKGLQSQEQKVLMLGDGLNDAGALQQSEVGVSLCEKNVNFFPASDALLQADSFGKLQRFLELTRSNKKVIYWAFALSFSYNIIGLAFAVAGWLSPLVAAILMPVSSVTIVLFTTLTNGYLSRKKLGRLP